MAILYFKKRRSNPSVNDLRHFRLHDDNDNDGVDVVDNLMITERQL